MSRIPFDQLAKQYLEDFLEPLGTIQRNLEVPGEPKFVDPNSPELPRLWVIAATTTQPVVTEFGGMTQPDWGEGIYQFPAAYRAAIIAIDQLPVTPDTLWLRLLGRDPVQQQVIAELLGRLDFSSSLKNFFGLCNNK